MNPTQPTHRRDFIKWGGITVGILILSPVVIALQEPEPKIEFNGYLLQGTHDGKILASSDDGNTWQKWMDFGIQNRVMKLGTSRSGVFAVLKTGIDEFQAYSFDGRVWRV